MQAQINCTVTVLDTTLAACNSTKLRFQFYSTSPDTITFNASLENDSISCAGAGIAPLYYNHVIDSNAAFVDTDTAQQSIVFFIDSGISWIELDLYIDCSLFSISSEINVFQTLFAANDSITVTNGDSNTFLMQGVDLISLQLDGNNTEFCTAYREPAILTHTYINFGKAQANIAFNAFVTDTTYCNTASLIAMDYSVGSGTFTS
ncbi:MAG: hypothetical protein IPO27_05675 [Bacteroidetes bacterium]|nr:hypothetical protein [Bacteroidota bacterium]